MTLLKPIKVDHHVIAYKRKVEILLLFFLLLFRRPIYLRNIHRMAIGIVNRRLDRIHTSMAVGQRFGRQRSPVNEFNILFFLL